MIYRIFFKHFFEILFILLTIIIFASAQSSTATKYFDSFPAIYSLSCEKREIFWFGKSKFIILSIRFTFMELASRTIKLKNRATTDFFKTNTPRQTKQLYRKGKVLPLSTLHSCHPFHNSYLLPQDLKDLFLLNKTPNFY